MPTATQTLEQLISQVVMKELGKAGACSTGACPTAKAVSSNPDGEIDRSTGVPVGISARHIHVTREHLDILYGKDHPLKVKKELMGGQYAADEQLTIVGTNLRVIENVRILGPERPVTQVEISKTDAIKLGINPPIRESGKIEGSAPITIVGPKGALSLSEGCIVAMRHIHMNEEDAKRLNVKDKEIVSVRTGAGARKGILSNVLVRVHPTFRLEMHIDTDEANAFAIRCNDLVEIIKH